MVGRATGLQSLPVVFGPDVAKWITVATIDVTQLAVAAYLYLGLDEPVYAAVLLGLIIPQVPPQAAHCSTQAAHCNPRAAHCIPSSSPL